MYWDAVHKPLIKTKNAFFVSMMMQRTKSVSSGSKSFGHMSHFSLCCQQADEYMVGIKMVLLAQMLVFHCSVMA